MSETQLIFQLSHPGRSATSQAPKALAEDKLSAIPAHLRRKEKPGLPEVSEMQVVRHYTCLLYTSDAADE